MPAAAAFSSSNRLTSVERLGVEERELLLDRDGQVGAALERRARLLEQLLVGNALRFTH